MAKKFLLILGVFSILGLSSSCGFSKPETKSNLASFEFNASELPWFNVEKPLTREDLKGKFVIFDFWTFCCINCIHIIPTLKRIEAKFPNEVLVIGVHSPKFKNEETDEELKKAIARYEIKHPVIQDRDFKLWKKYGVRAWPTLMFVSPDFKIIGLAPGEPDPENLIDFISEQVKSYKDKLDGKASDLVDISALKIKDEFIGELKYPAKIDYEPSTKRFAISDSNNNQIIITDKDGGILKRIGSGKLGKKDGNFKSASFNKPQGLKIAGDKVYVADTENHLIREIDLKSEKVKSIAGTGKQGARLTNKAVKATKNPISSPWDIEVIDNNLYFANAGSHQIGILDLNKEEHQNFAGSGREDIIDGEISKAALAQTSGLWASDDKNKLYFADSETSSIRVIDLKTNRMESLIGSGLFNFGDKDGYGNQSKKSPKALLQHSIGLNYFKNKIYIADSYNHKVKVLDLDSQKVNSLNFKIEGCIIPNPDYDSKDKGKPKEICLPSGLSEPAGLISISKKDLGEEGKGAYLFVSDTNNHRIIKVDLETMQASIFLI